MTALTDVTCDSCSSTDYKIFLPSTLEKGLNESKENQLSCTSDGHGIHYRLVECSRCGLIYASPRDNAPKINDLYSKTEDILYVEELEGRKRTFSRSLKNLEKYKKNCNLLDIGCHIGLFLSLASEKGFKVVGIEPSEWASSYAKEKFDLDVRQGTSKNLFEFEEKFDVITMWDVIEHVPSPSEVLIECNRALKTGGILAISTMRMDSLYVKLAGKKWPWYMKMHIYYFTKKNATELLEKSGFKVLEVKKYVHIVSLKYLLYKLKSVCKPVAFLFRLFESLVKCDNVFIPIAFGDFMELYAIKK